MRVARRAPALAALLPLLFLALAPPPATADKLCFPSDFLFGSATAAYQVEGAWNEGGRTPSIWDDYCRQQPIDCANVADDFYHRYAADIAMIKAAGHSSFRFSVSWSRAMNWDPASKHMKPNAPGLAFYHALIDELTRNQIQPILTIYHWDLPLELETQLAQPGWRTPDIHDHFVEFSELLFREFGHQVQHWATFNEPFIFTSFGYGATHLGSQPFAPGFSGSDTMQYVVAHNVILSHAKAVHKFRELQAQGVVARDASIGIVIPGDHTMPVDPSQAEDVAAADRVQQFMMGWFLGPIVQGDYPQVMRERVGDRLPRFTPDEVALVKGSYDVFMINHYSSHLATPCESPRSSVPCEKMAVGWERDLGVDNNIKPAGALASGVDADGQPLCGYFAGYPKGYRELIRWTHALNTSTPILLTENGYCGGAEVDDRDQLWYHQTYLEQVHLAIAEDHIPVIGYTAWSLMDNYEWGSFKPRFGLYYVNYTAQVGSKESWTPQPTDLARIPRPAATWFAEVATTKCMEPWKAKDSDQSTVKAAPSSTARTSTAFYIAATALVVVVVAAIAGVVIRRWRRGGNAQEQTSLLHA